MKDNLKLRYIKWGFHCILSKCECILQAVMTQVWEGLHTTEAAQQYAIVVKYFGILKNVSYERCE
jgi:hypothetical protein